LESLVAAKSYNAHKLKKKKETLSSTLNSFETKDLLLNRKMSKCMFLWENKLLFGSGGSWSVGSEGKEKAVVEVGKYLGRQSDISVFLIRTATQC
jgi:hypothetical protein